MTMESGGRREFKFPLGAAQKYGIAKNSLTRQVAELQRQGFIEVQSMANLRKPNEYRFLDDWRDSTKTGT